MKTENWQAAIIEGKDFESTFKGIGKTVWAKTNCKSMGGAYNYAEIAVRELREKAIKNNNHMNVSYGIITRCSDSEIIIGETL